jgi:hypothetical protein
MHFYDLKTGESVWEVPNASKPGKTRKPTIRDVRKGGLGVGVTSIIGFQSAPALENWKVNQGIMAALTYPNLDEIMREKGAQATVRMIVEDSREQAREAAERGSEIHEAIELSLKHGSPWSPVVEPTLDALRELGCIPGLYQVEQRFAHPLGFGGMVDFLSDDWVIDFKTKDFTPEDVEAGKVKAYDNHRLQLVAYDLGTRTRELDCDSILPRHDIWRKHANIFISRHPDHLGLAHVVVHDSSDEDKWQTWRHFYHLLRAFQAAKRIPMTGTALDWTGDMDRAA